MYLYTVCVAVSVCVMAAGSVKSRYGKRVKFTVLFLFSIWQFTLLFAPRIRRNMANAKHAVFIIQEISELSLLPLRGVTGPNQTPKATKK